MFAIYIQFTKTFSAVFVQASLKMFNYRIIYVHNTNQLSHGWQNFSIIKQIKPLARPGLEPQTQEEK